MYFVHCIRIACISVRQPRTLERHACERESLKKHRRKKLWCSNTLNAPKGSQKLFHKINSLIPHTERDKNSNWSAIDKFSVRRIHRFMLSQMHIIYTLLLLFQHFKITLTALIALFANTREKLCRFFKYTSEK